MYNYKYSLLGLFLSGLTINGSSCWIYLYWMDGCIFKFMEREKHLRCLPCIESCFQLAARFLRQSSMKTSGSSDYQRVLNSMHKTIILYLDYIYIWHKYLHKQCIYIYIYVISQRLQLHCTWMLLPDWKRHIEMCRKLSEKWTSTIFYSPIELATYAVHIVQRTGTGSEASWWNFRKGNGYWSFLANWHW